MTALSNAERQALWRERHPVQAAIQSRMSSARHRAHSGSYAASNTVIKRFIALDGEGAGVDERSRQNYLLLRAGSADGRLRRRLYTGERLTTVQCLEFILSLPADACLVGYFFGYDVTQILRDLPVKQAKLLFNKPLFWKSCYVHWKSYGIEYIPRQYFRVCRIDPKTRKYITGSTRTVNEVGGFFQKSFVQVLDEWKIGDLHIQEMIATQKDRREQFQSITETEDSYCAAECRLLAQLMQKFRDTCRDAKILPKQWRGAGHISARLHEIHRTPKAKYRQRTKRLDKMADIAYYGGRFEITIIGRINGTVWENDINSAYPAAMLQLPCPIHSRWQPINADVPLSAHRIQIRDITFSHHAQSFLCGFPIREKGRLYFPRQGTGIYWSPEIIAAQNAGATIELRDGYGCIEPCDCNFFAWVNELYEYRKAIGKSSQGYPIKLGINGLYGKFAQRIGSAPWQDYVMAGLITSITRSKLIDAYSLAPDDILYIATDGIYSKSKLALDVGNKLGQWEQKQRNGMFIVQPGIYWSNEYDANGNLLLPKTRGIPRSEIIKHRVEFETQWDRWLDRGATGDPPVVEIFVNQFVGLRAALARNKPQLAGTWLGDLRKAGDMKAGVRHINFDWQSKRRPYGDCIIGGAMVTLPFAGSSTLRSHGYDAKIIDEGDLGRQIVDADSDPDYIHWGNSGE